MKRNRKILSIVTMLALVLTTLISGSVLATNQYYRYTSVSEWGVANTNTAVMNVQEVVGSSLAGTNYKAYCMDRITYVNNTTDYILEDLTNTTIRSIVLQSYPNVSVATLEANLTGLSGPLTPLQAITGTQWAIWYNTANAGTQTPADTNALIVFEYFKNRTGTAQVAAPDTSISNFSQSVNGSGDAVITFDYDSGFTIGYSVDLLSLYSVTPVETTSSGITSVTITIPEADFNDDIDFDITLTGTQDTEDVYKYEPLPETTNQRLVGIQKMEHEADDSEAVYLEFIAKPAISITKTVDPNEAPYEVGETINFKLSVKNEGNVDLVNVMVTDDLSGLIVNSAELNIGNLAENSAAVVIDASYVVTATDLDAGIVINVATATGIYAETPTDITAEMGEVVTDTDRVEVTLIGTPDITITKTVDPNEAPYEVGETINFKLTVENTGTTDLTDVIVTDDLSGLIVNTDDLTIGNLAEGSAAVVIDASYVVTLTDLQAGSVYNMAEVEGMFGDEKVTDKDDVKIRVIGTPEITITKAVDPDEAPYEVGDTINFTLTVENTGNVDLINVTVTDDLSGLIVDEDDLDIGDLDEGSDAVIIDASYLVTLTDLQVGSVYNVATAAGMYADIEEEVMDTDSVKVAIVGSPEITLAKEVLNPIDETFGETRIADSGDLITYRFTVENTGNVDLTEVTITDTLIDETIVIGLLIPGEIQVSEVTYTISDGNFIESVFQNTSEVTGQYGDTTVNDNDSATVTRNDTPAIAIDKTADTQTGTVGTVIEYTIIVTNTGTVPLTNVYVEDQGTTYGPYSLAQGASMEIAPKPEYTITLDDVIYGSYTNVANAFGSYMEQVVKAKNDAIVNTYALPDISILKEVDNNSVFTGTTVNYTITVTNSGNIPLYDVELTDPMFDSGSIASWDMLQPGETHVITTGLSTVITTVGVTTNTATVKGWNYLNDETQLVETSTVDVTGLQRPIIIQNDPSIFVSISPDNTLVLLGTDVTFTMVVKNTGNTILNGVTITNTALGFSETLTDILYVGQTRTFTAVKTMDQLLTFNTDVTVTGLSPQSVAVDDASDTLVNVYEEDEPIEEDPIPTDNPQTGQIPSSMLLLGGLLTLALGFVLIRKKKTVK